MQGNSTINYYNDNAQAFVENTRDVDFHILQDKFLAMLPEDARILDLGCGAGRDTKYFLDKNYRVDAVDGAEKLCELASEYTGIPVKHLLFQDMAYTDVYDGIWACASLIHVPSKELRAILLKVKNALKPGGILYLSFKYGESEGERNGRYFVDMTEKKFTKLMEEMDGLHLVSHEITTDVRPERDEKWLNLILRKEA